MVKLDPHLEILVFWHKVENSNHQLCLFQRVSFLKVVVRTEIVGQLVLVALLVLYCYRKMLIVVQQIRQLRKVYEYFSDL